MAIHIQAVIHQIEPNDDMILALQDLTAGQQFEISGQTVTLQEDIPGKHQFAIRDFKKGETVRMHGVIVGEVTKNVYQGTRFRLDNLSHSTGGYKYRNKKDIWQPPDITAWQDVTFSGYLRRDGSVGTANYWIIVPLVFCENENVNTMKDAFISALGYQKSNAHQSLVHNLIQRFQSGAAQKELLDIAFQPDTETDRKQRLFPNVDGIKFLNHHMGCGGTPRDAELLCNLLAGYVNHPNVAGATVLSLGCQNAQADILLERLKQRNPDFDKPLFIFEQQKSTSEQDMLADAIRKTFVGLVAADKARRSRVPLRKLVIGMECGGSDGFSGVSANPVMGSVSDIVVACGGSVILAEFPEFCGGEQSLLDRCVDAATARRFITLYEAYEDRARSVGARFDMNPSAGNIREGLITDAIKSAGAIKKGGTSPVVDVLDYPFWITKAGLTLLCTPGGDVESTTALAAAGANLILFSTGLGTPTGNPIVPVIKIASNTTMAAKLSDIIDFDAGPIIDGSQTITTLAESLLHVCVDVAGQKYLPKAVQSGHDEFIPWKRDVSL